jgi:hypothetical protein
MRSLTGLGRIVVGPELPNTRSRHRLVGTELTNKRVPFLTDGANSVNMVRSRYPAPRGNLDDGPERLSDEERERLTDELANKLLAMPEFRAAKTSSPAARKQVAEQFLISQSGGFSPPAHLRDERSSARSLVHVVLRYGTRNSAPAPTEAKCGGNGGAHSEQVREAVARLAR